MPRAILTQWMANARYELRKQLNAQRTEDYRSGTYALAGGVVDPLPDDAPQFIKELPCLLQNITWFPQTFTQLKQWLEQNILTFIHQYASTII